MFARNSWENVGLDKKKKKFINRQIVVSEFRICDVKYLSRIRFSKIWMRWIILNVANVIEWIERWATVWTPSTETFMARLIIILAHPDVSVTVWIILIFPGHAWPGLPCWQHLDYKDAPYQNSNKVYQRHCRSVYSFSVHSFCLYTKGSVDTCIKKWCTLNMFIVN